MSYAAIVLAGGHGKRMGGILKPLVSVGGIPMITRVLKALAPAGDIVVVGPSELDGYLTPGARRTREEPPGGGPVAGIAAGFALCGDAQRIVVAAGDLPFLSWAAITLLAEAQADCAVYVDHEGRRQPLVAVWQNEALESALHRVPATGDVGLAPVASSLHPVPGKGSSMKELLAGVDVVEVTWPGDGPKAPAPWYDCDTPEQLRQAEEFL